jgi:hypothetical protein
MFCADAGNGVITLLVLARDISRTHPVFRKVCTPIHPTNIGLGRQGNQSFQTGPSFEVLNDLYS